MGDKENHEDQAIAALVDELTVRGRQAKLTTNPDRDASHPLTVDAIIEIDGTEWAVDHCLVSRPVDLPPALQRAEKELRSPLEAIAASGFSLHAQFEPQSSKNRTDQQIVGYYQQVVQLARQAT